MPVLTTVVSLRLAFEFKIATEPVPTATGLTPGRALAVVDVANCEELGDSDTTSALSAATGTVLDALTAGTLPEAGSKIIANVCMS